MADDHVVIVTGAAAGLGNAMARALVSAGRRVVGVDIADADADGSPARFLPISADVRREPDCTGVIAQAIERFGRVDALINNAGLGMAGMRGNRQPTGATSDAETVEARFTGRMPGVPFYDVDVERWQALIETNLNGPFWLARAIAPHLIAQSWGRIVNVTTSYATMLRGGNSPYGPAKAALEAATVIWSEELATTGVSVNVLIPGGAADTAMVPHDNVSERESLVPPSVMQAPAIWLTSHASDGVTGKRIVARDWDPGAPDERNLACAVAPAGWRS